MSISLERSSHESFKKQLITEEQLKRVKEKLKKKVKNKNFYNI
jgi:hypothetical protein